MPTTYAHWRFGDRCIATLPERLQRMIKKNRAIFDFGVHGPDIYFYFHCLKKNHVNKFGSCLHDIPFGDTLKKVRKNFLTCDDREAAFVYLLGFTCHFTLDSYCHGYIERKEEVTCVTHGKIESQFDRYLLQKDGFDPVKKSVTFSLKPNRHIAHVISQIFPEWDDKTTYQTLCDMKMYLNLLKDSSDWKRMVLSYAMDIFHVSSYKDLFITKENNPAVYDAMIRLDKLSDNALEHYPILAKSLYEFLKSEKTLDVYFHHHFCPKSDYKEIPVLPLEEELLFQTKIQD